MKKRIECIIYGRVQLVGFRYFILKNAKRLGILGTVENLQDGSVRVLAEGEEDKLPDFISYLKKGPIFSKIEDIKITFNESSNEFNDFHIIY